MTHHCRILSMGAVSALGAGVKRHYEASVEGDRSSLQQFETALSGRRTLVGSVREVGDYPQLPLCFRSRNTNLLLDAAEQIADDIVALRGKFGANRLGVVIGSSTSGIANAEEAIRSLVLSGGLPESYLYPQQEMGAVSAALANRFELTGPTYTVSTACSSGAKVFHSGRSLLENGICDAVVVGGADTLCQMTIEGFGSLELLSNELTNPFSSNRAGISIGEAACLFVLTRDAGGVQLVGVGESSDAYHMSAPDPLAGGATAALVAALSDAQLYGSDITYLNLHGTGTPANDAMEARAVVNVFGDDIEKQPWCSSTKPLTGHTLGASGAIEAGFCWAVLESFLRTGRVLLPRHIYDGSYDSAIPRIRLVEGLVEVTQDVSGKELYLMSNSFGFGGSNCALILGARMEDGFGGSS